MGTVTIEPVNDFPDAVADVATTTEEMSVTINVLANDTDIDGDALSVVSVSQGRNGSVVIDGNDTLTYTPNPRFYGMDRFSYVARDEHGAHDHVGPVERSSHAPIRLHLAHQHRLDGQDEAHPPPADVHLDGPVIRQG